MRGHIVHPANQRVPFDSKEFKNFQDRVGIVLTAELGLQQVEEDEVWAFLSD